MLQCQWLYIILGEDMVWCATEFNFMSFVISYILIYMNDLPLCLDDVDITMFADGTNLMKAINSLKEIKEEVISALMKVYNRLRCNKLSLNTVKTAFMSIGTHQKLERFDHDPAGTPYMISAGADCEIKRVRIVMYLVLIVDDIC